MNGLYAEIDFGYGGVTAPGLPQGTAATNAAISPTGNGWYEAVLCSTLNGTTTQVGTAYFFRLLGDLDYTPANNGPYAVDSSDSGLVNTTQGQAAQLSNQALLVKRQLGVSVAPPSKAWAPGLVHQELAPGSALPPKSVSTLTAAQVQPLLTAAENNWKAAGLNAAGLALLKTIKVDITALPVGLVGEYGAGVIYLDPVADGYGWFVDSTPAKNEEFSVTSPGNDLLATGKSPAAGHVDLLTVLEHELGHVLGLPAASPQIHPGDIMLAALGLGERRTPDAFDVGLLTPVTPTPTPTPTPTKAAVTPMPNKVAVATTPTKAATVPPPAKVAAAPAPAALAAAYDKVLASWKTK
jgi:hypothetical protein